MKKILALILALSCAFCLCAYADEVTDVTESALEETSNEAAEEVTEEVTDENAEGEAAEEEVVEEEEEIVLVFEDMPDDWSTAALEAAVKNGLLTGDNGFIKAQDNMTRAEMATIMVRACGATRTTDISGYIDVMPYDWFYDAMNKAVAMGAFKGTGNELNPNDPITREEAFVVLSRVFGIAAGTVPNENLLYEFKDSQAVSSWARKDVTSIIEHGYVAGSDGFIKPLDNISRAEFAVVMDRMIKYYIDDANDSIPADGNVVIRTKDVDLTGITSEKLIVLGDAFGEEDVYINDANLTGKLVIRGGKNVTGEGSYNEVAIVCPDITFNAGLENVKHVDVCKGSVFNIMSILGQFE